MQKINKLSKIQVKKPPAVVLERFHGAFGRIISERYSTCGSGNAAAASIVDSAVWEHLVFVLLRGRTKNVQRMLGMCGSVRVRMCVHAFLYLFACASVFWVLARLYVCVCEPWLVCGCVHVCLFVCV